MPACPWEEKPSIRKQRGSPRGQPMTRLPSGRDWRRARAISWGAPADDRVKRGLGDHQHGRPVPSHARRGGNTRHRRPSRRRSHGPFGNRPHIVSPVLRVAVLRCPSLRTFPPPFHLPTLCSRFRKGAEALVGGEPMCGRKSRVCILCRHMSESPTTVL